ncbi:MAG: SBBP repeat-containing protein, partial [Gammaproteobacteria bacterium]|nr:SBBP repeat-containing protein [Gammaproteobacteria bacterium]
MIKNGFLFPYQATIIGLMLLLSSSTAWAQADIQYFFTYVGADQFDTVYDTHIREENGEEYIYAVGSSMRHHSNGQPTLDAFVAKYHLHNQQLIFTEFFSGAEHESARQLVLDESGFIYVVGETNSTDFPITNDAQIHQGQWDAFILKLDSDTGDRVYATYFGGSANDFGHAIAVDQQQRIYISGETYSTDLPTSDNAFIKNCLEQNICSTNGENPSNAFIMQLDTRNAAARPAYTSYFGGSGTDKSHSIAIDVFDHVHIAGDTNSIDLPSKSAYQTQLAGGFDGFIARFNVIASKNDQSLQTAGYFGGLHDDTINTIGLDELGNLWIAGETASENLPTTRHAFDRSCGDDFTPCQLNGSQQHNDAYIAKFSHAAGGVLLYSSYWGGRSNDAILHLSIASDARLFVVGMTESPNLAITDNAYDQACGENQLCDNNNDGFIAFFKIEN